MKTILASGVAAAALAAVASMPASAECINGYETLGNQVVVLCEAGPGQFGAADEGMIPDDQFVEGDEPLYTGSIAPADEPDGLADEGFIEEPLAAAAAAPSAIADEAFVEEPVSTVAVAPGELREDGFVEEPLYTGSIDRIDENEVPGQIPNDAEFAATGEPVLTGSTVAAAEEEEIPGQIPAEGSPAAGGHLMMAGSFDECRPGQFWMAQWETAEVPLACPR